MTLRHIFSYRDVFVFFDEHTLYNIKLRYYFGAMSKCWYAQYMVGFFPEPDIVTLFREFEWNITYPELMDWYDDYLIKACENRHKVLELEILNNFYFYFPESFIDFFCLFYIKIYLIYLNILNSNISPDLLWSYNILEDKYLQKSGFFEEMVWHTSKGYREHTKWLYEFRWVSDAFFLIKSSFYSLDAEERLTTIFNLESAVKDDIQLKFSETLLKIQQEQFKLLFQSKDYFDFQTLPPTHAWSLRRTFTETYMEALKSFQRDFSAIVDDEHLQTRERVTNGPFTETYIFLQLKRQKFYPQYIGLLKAIGGSLIQLEQAKAVLKMHDIFVEEGIKFTDEFSEVVEFVRAQQAEYQLLADYDISRFYTLRERYVADVIKDLGKEVIKQRFLYTYMSYPGVFFQKWAVWYSLYWAPLTVVQVSCLMALVSFFWSGGN